MTTALLLHAMPGGAGFNRKMTPAFRQKEPHQPSQTGGVGGGSLWGLINVSVSPYLCRLYMIHLSLIQPLLLVVIYRLHRTVGETRADRLR